MNSEQMKRGLKSTFIGICLNFVLAIIKFVAGIFGNSYALIADAIESTADIFTSIVVWFGLKLAVKAPDESHPYGHGKAEPLTALFVSMALVVAAIFIAKDSIHNILTPHELPKKYTLIVLLVVIIIKEALYRYVNATAEELDSHAIKSDAQHHRADVITSSTAFIGISVAIIGGKGYESADDWAALIAAVIIIYNSYHIFRPSFAEVMDTAPPKEMVNDIRNISKTIAGVQDIDKCYVRKMGFDYFIDIHIVVDGNLSVREGHHIGHQVKDKIREIRPWVKDVLTHIEPM
jgi:cation diffusion facilitator family transporter